MGFAKPAVHCKMHIGLIEACIDEGSIDEGNPASCQVCAAVGSTVMLLRLCTLVCRDRVFFRCTSACHADQEPCELGRGNGVGHVDILRGSFGCVACNTLCVFALFSGVFKGSQ